MNYSLDVFVKENPFDWVSAASVGVSALAILISGALSAFAIRRSADLAMKSERIKRIDETVQHLIIELISIPKTEYESQTFKKALISLRILLPTDTIFTKLILEHLDVDQWLTDDEYEIWRDQLVKYATEYYSEMVK